MLSSLSAMLNSKITILSFNFGLSIYAVGEPFGLLGLPFLLVAFYTIAKRRKIGLFAAFIQ